MIWIKRFFVLALITLIAIQFVRPDRNNGGYESLKPFLAETKPSDQVAAILKTACYDCHSNQTHYPWYAEVAPASLWLNDHIEEGRGHLNFAEWDRYSTKRKGHKLEELVEMVENGEMPLKSYTFIHKEANLTPAETTALLDWAKVARLNYSLKAVRPE